MEYIQGIAVKSYNLTGEKSKALNRAVDENTAANIKLEITFVPIMFLQSLTAKLIGVVIARRIRCVYLSGTMGCFECRGHGHCRLLSCSVRWTVQAVLHFCEMFDLNVSRRSPFWICLRWTDGRDITPTNYDIDVENVEFSYDKRKIIDGVSVHIPQKTTTAIVGPSGGGKTTLCHLIARFWDVDRGCVRLGGMNVKDYSMDSLMKNFSFVFQSVYLFQDTIANNIRFGQPDAPMEKGHRSSEKSLLSRFHHGTTRWV